MHLLVLDLDDMADIFPLAQVYEDYARELVKPTHILRVCKDSSGFASVLAALAFDGRVTVATPTDKAPWWRVVSGDRKTVLTLPDGVELTNAPMSLLEWALGLHGIPRPTIKKVLDGTLSPRSRYYQQVEKVRELIEAAGDPPSGLPVEVLDAEVQQVPGTYLAITTRQGFLDAIEECRGRVVAWDTETTGIDPLTDTIVGFSFCAEEGKAWYVPLAHVDGPNMPMSVFLEVVPLLFHGARTVAHNAKFDIQVMRHLGVTVPDVVDDTLLQAWLLNHPRLGLKSLTKEVLGINQTTIESLIGKGKHAITMDQVSVDKATHYAAQDADLTLRLHNVLTSQLSDEERKLYTDLEVPLIPILAEMELTGMPVDAARLEARKAELEDLMESLEKVVYSMVGPVNLASDREMRSLLFEKLGLQPVKLTNNGQYATDEDTLRALQDQHPVIPFILRWNEYQKEMTAFILPYLNKHVRGGRIYTNLNQTGTVTGRLSSNNPNLQQVPASVRKCFVAPEGWVFLGIDYSQLEMRVMGYVSNDPTLVRTLQEGGDLHAATMRVVLGLEPDKLKAKDPSRYNQLRTIAKNIGFGIAYGAQEDKVVEQVRKAGADVTRQQVQDFFREHRRQYSRLWQWRNEAIQFARDNGYAKTILGRRRHLPEITSPDAKSRSAAEREAVNTVIQGSAADIVKAAQKRAYRAGALLGAKMVLQIHDEIIWIVQEENIEEAKIVLARSMQHPNLIHPVPLVVEPKVGKAWSDLK